MTYRIKNWDMWYEKAQTRRCKNMSWVATPNRHDGSGYRRVAEHERNCELFCAWCLILQVASRMPKRGLLVKDGRALTESDLAYMTGFPKEIFSLAFTVLIGSGIGWLERVAGDEIPGNPKEKTPLDAETEDTMSALGERATMVCLQDRTGQDTTRHCSIE